MGFIGENGAGKSTTIKLILNLIHRDSGKISIFGWDNIEYENKIKEDIGVVFEENNLPENMTITDVSIVMRNIYKNWDSKVFNSFMKEFSLPAKKTIKEFSRGMKMKLSIAVALSHHAKLLILDEATSGLDPIIREEILDMFLEFIQDEEHSIFASSHIISDLEKVADYITFIHKGRILFSESKDNLLCKYGVLKCRASEFEIIDKSIVAGYRKSKFGVEALVLKDKIKGKHIIDHASIEDIMLFSIKGESK
ncbi:MAG TPA: ABC transporter ATP-binding protein [Clostridiaceae bacterium]|nr:ABC transporter ATP-binding protein [Clostridiaceae bacterium]